MTVTVPEPIPGWPAERQVARLAAWLAAVTDDDPAATEMFAGLVIDGDDPKAAASVVIDWWRASADPPRRQPGREARVGRTAEPGGRWWR